MAAGSWTLVWMVTMWDIRSPFLRKQGGCNTAQDVGTNKNGPEDRLWAAHDGLGLVPNWGPTALLGLRDQQRSEAELKRLDEVGGLEEQVLAEDTEPSPANRLLKKQGFFIT